MNPAISALPSLWPTGPRAGSDILRIAHRGGAAGAEDYRPQNLRRLAGLGAHLVEIDVRTTADGRLVAHHDPTARVNGFERRVSEHTLADWRQLLSAGRMPLAGDVVIAVRNAGLGLYLDVKDVTGAGATELVQLLTSEQMTTRTILASTDPATVAAFARVSDRIPRAVLFRSRDEDPVRLARAAQAHFLHPCWEDAERPDRLLTPTWLNTVRRQGLGVVCWHEERPDVLAALRDLGVDGICTDDPEILTDVLRR
jgi:glycerophosphoryl diester phosphodiesterase